MTSADPAPTSFVVLLEMLVTMISLPTLRQYSLASVKAIPRANDAPPRTGEADALTE